MRRLAPAVVGALVAALTLAGCTTGDPETIEEVPITSPDAAFQRYVALGDSFTAAPYVPDTDVAGGCLRSDANYPSLVASELDITALVDVSCSGADTTDMRRGQRLFTGERALPQLRPVNASADLVTVGLGGNDFGIFGTLSRTCPVTGPDGKRVDPSSGPRCGGLDAGVADRLPALQRRLVGVLREVTRRAPDAEVVLVGYPRFVDAGRACAQLPLTEQDARTLDAFAGRLSATMARAARTAGAAYADLHRASRGHGVCAGAEAWVNGVRTDTARALALHPTPEGQVAVARIVADLLR